MRQRIPILLSCVWACSPVDEKIDTGADPQQSDSADTDDSADTGAPEDTGDTGDTGDTEPTLPDLRSTGPHGVGSEVDYVEVDDDCHMELVVVSPAGTDPIGTVVLSHGFLRSGNKMTGWAEHMASWGLRVVVPELCHLTARDSDHEANGAELALLVDAMGLGPVVYAGHSAGGLASLLALTHDPDALGGVGLDPVDADSLGASASVSQPMHVLVGEPGLCNSSANGVDLARGTPWKVSEAGHCDFENPTDAVCDLACGQANPTFDDNTLQQTIRGMLTAGVLGLSGDADTARAWWAEGGEYNAVLQGMGALQAP